MSWFPGSLALPSVLAGALLVACGEGDACDCQCPPVGTGGNDGQGTGGAGGIGGTGGAGSLQITADQWGIVSLVSEEFGMNMYLQVTFSDTPRVLDPSCQIHATQNCDVRICPATEPVPADLAPDAGAIQVVSGQVVGQALIEPDASGLYSGGFYGFGDASFFFQGGEPLTFVASGGEVPGFDVSSTYPAALSVLAPVADAGVLTATPTEGLTLTLSGPGGEGDELFIYGRATNVDGLETSMACTFPTAPASVTLGPDVVGLLPEGYALTVYRMHREQFLAGPYDVTIRMLGELADSTASEAVSIVVGAASAPAP